jgi:hypothetical protein
MRNQNCYVEAQTNYGDEKIFFSVSSAIKWLKKVTKGDEYAQGYLIVHEHSIDSEDCECYQYLTDHNPVVVGGREY